MGNNYDDQLPDNAVFTELREARRLWGSKGTDLTKVLEGLFWVLTRCPEHLKETVMYHMDECTRRSTMMDILTIQGGGNG